ncbi:DUF4124 domain-containing protein [Billgrantia azerbaijanica]|nr:DUF4124 domain-containing protein [Halomonas azerbaijanica]
MAKVAWIVVMGLALAAQAGATTVYRTTDAQGNVVFTDDPERGGERVELEPVTVVPSREAGAAPRAQPETTQRPESAPGRPFMPYDRFRIATPADEETLPTGAAGNVAVELAIVPPLREDHRVRLLLDGRVSQSALHTDAFLLNNLPRGEHVLQAELLDAGGEVRHRTEPVTLYVQRASVNLPQNPNNPASN